MGDDICRLYYISNGINKIKPIAMKDKIKMPYLLIVFGLYLVFMIALLTKCQAQSKRDLMRFCVQIDMEHPEIVVRQILYETKHLKSNLFEASKNCFGMKIPAQRRSIRLSDDGTYSVYRHWKESLLDYRIWQYKYYKGGCYYEFLKTHGYSTNKKYCKTLRQIKL